MEIKEHVPHSSVVKTLLIMKIGIVLFTFSTFFVRKVSLCKHLFGIRKSCLESALWNIRFFAHLALVTMAVEHSKWPFNNPQSPQYYV